MRKNCSEVVVKLFNLGCKNLHLITTAGQYLNNGVQKLYGLRQLIPQSFHHLNTFLIPVIFHFLPGFHTTYDKLLINKFS